MAITPPRPGTPSRLQFIVVWGACFLMACAAVGPPLPPRVEKPERVTDLAVAQIGRRFEISFTIPEQAMDGERLSKPVEIQILRAVTSPGQTVPETPAAFSPWVTLERRDLPQATQNDKTQYTSALADQEFSQYVGSSFSFAVRALTRGFRGHAALSDPSNIVHFALLDVSGPVQDVKPRTTEKAVELSWSEPARSLTGRPLRDLSGYRVYRSEVTSPGPFQLLGETRSAAYVDPDFHFGHRYSYKVRAIFKRGDQTAQSEDSEPAEITPLDTFPPAAPQGLSAVYSDNATELIWTANPESDLAGYNVYRREASGPPQRLNRDLLLTPIYRDSGVPADHKYLYHVTAVDLANNESRASAEIAVESR